MRTKPRKWMAAVLALACVLGLGGCMVIPEEIQIPEAEKLVVRSGNDGEAVEVMDQEAIRRVTENINALKFEKGYSSEDYDGWRYTLSWYDSDGGLLESITVMTDNQISYGGYFYVSIGAGIDTALLDELLDGGK